MLGHGEQGRRFTVWCAFEAGAAIAASVDASSLCASLSLYGLSEFGLASLGHGTSVSLLAGLSAVLLLVVLTAAALSFAGYSSRIDADAFRAGRRRSRG